MRSYKSHNHFLTPGGELHVTGPFPMGHRRKGEGYDLSMLADIERAQVLSRHKGRTLYVDSGLTASGNGDSWSGAYITLAAALANALADDTIYIAPGHTESIIAAGTITVSKAGVTIIGMGRGRRRPVFTWSTATTATFLVTAASVTISNCVFIGEGIDAIVTMFGITADDCSFIGNEFQIGKTSFVPLLGITITGTINRFKFIGNFVHGLAVANCTNFIQIAGGGDGHWFESNTIYGNFTTSLGAINNITTLCTNVTLIDNTIRNGTASATKCVVFLTGTTGFCARNTFGVGSGAAPLTGDQMHRASNGTVAAVATDGSAFI